MYGTQMLNQLPYFKSFKSVQFSSFDRSGGNDDFITIRAGDQAVIAEVEGPGCVSRIWLTIAAPDPYILRRSLIRMYWDGEAAPSVEAPIGDFFGVGFSRIRHYAAQPLGMSSGGFYSYFPMPFSQGARIEIVNESPFDMYAFYFHVNVHIFDRLEDDTSLGRFHARWRRETTIEGMNYTLLEARGRGHYVGSVVSMQGLKPFSYWFLEGDEMIYVDGEPHPPAYHGTGTEDYFNSGWYFNKGTFAAPFHGLTIKTPLPARVSAYRFHVEDPIPFEKEIRVTLEHGGTNDVPGSDYSTTAYWYQDEPHTPMGLFPPVSDRLPEDFILLKEAKKAAGGILDFGFRLGMRIRNIIQ